MTGTAHPAITIEGLSKQFGPVRAVDDLSFTVRRGAVTGFLGPNGSGKTTTLRMLLGLTAPTSGRALVGDRPYADHPRPGRVVGSALEASSFHPGRSGLAHLEVFAPQIGVDRARCREVLDLVGLTEFGVRRVGTYSMGMRQRLGLATALLADPPILVLDEPANGLDPEGIVWLRGLLRRFAAEGRTVLVSSHVLGEVQSTVDDVVIIAGGRLVHASALEGLAALAEPGAYLESPDHEGLDRLLTARGWRGSPEGHGTVIAGVSAAQAGAAAYDVGLELHQLSPRGTDLEEVFLRLISQATKGER
ncbi:ATP-binding cassette domain-containing protein [Nocardioides salsibiostraticola]